MALEAVVKLTKEQYEILANGGTVGPYTGIDNTKYLYFVQDDISAGSSARPVYFLNGSPVACAHSLEADVPSDADFNNYYHKTGSWNGLTYTAGKVGSPDDLVFTIPTGNTQFSVARGDHDHDSRYVKYSAAQSLTDTQKTQARTNIGAAPIDHASANNTYGLGDATYYGHVKLVTGDLNGKVSAVGMAASQSHTHSQYLQKNTAITSATKCKITYDANGLVTAGADLAASDIPDLSGIYLPLTGGTLTGTLNVRGGDTTHSSISSAVGNDINIIAPIGQRVYINRLTLGDIGAVGKATISKSNVTDQTYTLPASGGTFAMTSDIPTVTNYYWADVKVSASSNKGTTPTVDKITIGGSGSTAGKATMQYNATEDCIDFVFA